METNIPIKRCICFFLPDVCQLRSRHIDKFVHASESEIFFRPKCGKLAVKWDWNSTNPQNVPFWVFFGKLDGLFAKNLLESF